MERFLPSLKIRPCDAEAGTSALQREVEEWVNALYGLQPEEIKIVQGAAK